MIGMLDQAGERGLPVYLQYASIEANAMRLRVQIALAHPTLLREWLASRLPHESVGVVAAGCGCPLWTYLSCVAPEIAAWLEVGSDHVTVRTPRHDRLWVDLPRWATAFVAVVDEGRHYRLGDDGRTQIVEAIHALDCLRFALVRLAESGGWDA